MAKKTGKMQTEAGAPRAGQSPPSASRLERKRKGAGDKSPKTTPKVAKAEVGSGGRKALH